MSVILFTDGFLVNYFHETVILVNGEVQPDASNLVENDTVLIICRGMGLPNYWPIDKSPRCVHDATARISCGSSRQPCSKPSANSFSYYWYFMPVLMSDDGLRISFTTFSKSLCSATLNGKSVLCDCI